MTCSSTFLKYRKIPKISPGAYIFQRPFLRGLFLEGLIFGGAYLWREICVSKSIGLALQLEVKLPYLLCFTLCLRAISKYKPLGGLYLESRFNGEFFCVTSLGVIFGGAYFRNFTVSLGSFGSNSCCIYFDVLQCIFNDFYCYSLLPTQEKSIEIGRYLVSELR